MDDKEEPSTSSQSLQQNKEEKWDAYLMDRMKLLSIDIPQGNGFNLCGYPIGESVLELILSKVDEKDILKCNLVSC